YTFYLSTSQIINPVNIIIYGTDYDYDNDGDYTDFAVLINGQEIVYAQELTKYGLGKDGSRSQVKFDISQYVRQGQNTLVLQNTENSDQRDYNYIEWVKIATSNSTNNTYSNNTPIILNQSKYIGHKFTCQTKRKYTFGVYDLSAARNAQLILSGYDTDYDKDGDYTDFAISVNGNSLFNAEPLRDKGFGVDGRSQDLSFNIGAYLHQGQNEIILENTEIEGQLDYVFIGSIKISTGSMPVSNQLKVNTPYLLSKRFNSQAEQQIAFTLSNSADYDELKLKIYGTDVDDDNDGDFTDFLVQINGSTIVDTQSLTEYGLGINGTYAYAVFDIKTYLNQGNNIITLKNTEDNGQVDYAYIKSIEISGNQSYSYNKPPEIIITHPQLERGFKIISSSTSLNVEGIATDEDGIERVLINNVDAQLSAKGFFSAEIPIKQGTNTIIIVAIDKKGATATKSFTITNGTTTAGNTQLGETGKYYALIIGVSDYDDPKIPDLRGEPTADAQELYNILTQNYTFDAENIKLLLNPTYRQVIRSFDDFSKIITENDNFLIFYAGHGNWDETSEIGYWLPKDAELGYTDAWLYNSVLVDNIRKVNSKHTLLLADACFSGGIFRTRSVLQGASKSIQKKYKLKSRNAITSGALKTVPNKSVFFKYLSNRLQTNTDKYLPASELFNRIETPVGNNSPNIPQYGDIQNVGDEGGDFIFIKR
ncbi:MAG: caspase family protein, partial [Bacteroidales bacterium]|nr:caspase family protein [Bacteroidales bacterium]